MEKLICALCILTFSIQCLGFDIWVIAPERPADEVIAKYRSQFPNDNFVSSFEYLLGHPTTPDQMNNILSLDSQARAALLNGKLQKSLDIFNKLKNILFSYPNVAGLEKVTLSTLVNIAQVNSMLHLSNSEGLWREAHSWAPESILSPEEFSPAVILNYQKSVSVSKKQWVRVATSPESFVYLDGRQINATDPSKPALRTKQVEPGHHQISVISPGLNWNIKNFYLKDKSKGLTLEIMPSPFLSGTCQAPKFVGSSVPTQVRVLAVFENDCGRVYYKSQWYTTDGVKLSIPHLDDSLKPELATSSIPLSPPEKRNFIGSLTKSGWFWAGLGVAILGAVAISANSQTTTVPTHTMR